MVFAAFSYAGMFFRIFNAGTKLDGPLYMAVMNEFQIWLESRGLLQDAIYQQDGKV